MDKDDADIEMPSNRARHNKQFLPPQWNLVRIATKLSTHAEGVKFAEDNGLLPKTRICSTHKTLMHCILTDYDEVGSFFCSKGLCQNITDISRAKGTLFEDASLSFAHIYYLMYCFANRFTPEETIHEDFVNGSTLTPFTIIKWYNYFLKAIVSYQLDHLEYIGKIGGPKKVVEIEETKLEVGKYSRLKNFDNIRVIVMVENGRKDVRLEVCPDDKCSLETIIPLIKKHVRGGTTIKMNSREAYDCLQNYGYRVEKQNESDESDTSEMDMLPPDCDLYSERIETQRNLLRKLRNSKGFNSTSATFADIIVEFIWRQSIMTKQKDYFLGLVEAISYAYNKY